MDTLENYNTYKANNRHQHPHHVRSPPYTIPDSYSPIKHFLDLYKLSHLTRLDHFPGRKKHCYEQWEIWKMSNISKTHFKFYICRIHWKSFLTKLVEGKWGGLSSSQIFWNCMDLFICVRQWLEFDIKSSMVHFVPIWLSVQVYFVWILYLHIASRFRPIR